MNKLRTFLIAAGLSGATLTGGVFIAEHEGRVLETYVDPVGILTSCYGHTDAELELGQFFTEQQCLAQLADDLDVAARQLHHYTVPVQLTDSEKAAYLSFIYNVGAEAFRTSTLRKKLLAGDHTGACNELSRWVYAKGEILPGLVKRRSAERELCLQELTNVEITERRSWQRATLRDWRFDPGLRWAWRGVVLLES
ncbi:lysozyme [Shewanella sp. YQ_9]|uniref:lysozyme n=1 Tax=Shewanella sp. YQ_9 TaxID=3367231 RepID=UPI00370AAB1D